jgi:hypothetical protein
MALRPWLGSPPTNTSAFFNEVVGEDTDHGKSLSFNPVNPVSDKKFQKFKRFERFKKLASKANIRPV